MLGIPRPPVCSSGYSFGLIKNGFGVRYLIQLPPQVVRSLGTHTWCMSDVAGVVGVAFGNRYGFLLVTLCGRRSVFVTPRLGFGVGVGVFL